MPDQGTFLFSEARLAVPQAQARTTTLPGRRFSLLSALLGALHAISEYCFPNNLNAYTALCGLLYHVSTIFHVAGMRQICSASC